jgi:hypothetical protein
VEGSIVALQDIILFDPVASANIPMSGLVVPNAPDIVLRKPLVSADIVLMGAIATMNLWINTSGGKKRAIYVFENTAGGVKQVTDLAINTSGGRRDVIFS